jgi:uncharacterized protein (TIGR02147 family)
MNSIFTYDSYKQYIEDYLGSQEKSWGTKSRLCQAMQIHNAYLSQVLKGSKHLTLEQAERLGKVLLFTENEFIYWILMIQKNRAGTKDLEGFFDRRMEEVRTANMDLSHRLGKKDGLKEKDQEIYYSSWHYGAIHVALMVEAFRTPVTLAQRLQLEESKVLEVLEFLIQVGLVKKAGGKFLTTSNWIRLPKSSSCIIQHHSNLRIQALDSIYTKRTDDLHYSGYLTFSTKDASVIQDLWLKTLKETQKIIEPSPSEDIFGICLDLFKVR